MIGIVLDTNAAMHGFRWKIRTWELLSDPKAAVSLALDRFDEDDGGLDSFLEDEEVMANKGHCHDESGSIKSPERSVRLVISKHIHDSQGSSTSSVRPTYFRKYQCTVLWVHPEGWRHRRAMLEIAG